VDRAPALLLRFCGDMGVGPGTESRPDLRIGRRRLGCLNNDLPTGSPVLGTHQRCWPDLAGPGKRPGFTGPGGQPVRAIPQPEKGMTVTIVETRAPAHAITGGVDTHAGVHVAATLRPRPGDVVSASPS